MALADVAYCNGGDPQLLHALLTRGQYMELTGYAGWNTAGNTLGTVYAHAALHAVGRAKGFTPAMERAHYAALMIRLLDDGVYQPIIRAWIGHRAEENGLSPLNLSLDAARVDIWVNSAMQQCWTDMRERYPCLAACDRPFTATLPWGRVFEVRIALPD